MAVAVLARKVQGMAAQVIARLGAAVFRTIRAPQMSIVVYIASTGDADGVKMLEDAMVI